MQDSDDDIDMESAASATEEEPDEHQEGQFFFDKEEQVLEAREVVQATAEEQLLVEGLLDGDTNDNEAQELMEEPKEEIAQVAEDYRDLGHWWRASHLESFEDVLREARTEDLLAEMVRRGGQSKTEALRLVSPDSAEQDRGSVDRIAEKRKGLLAEGRLLLERAPSRRQAALGKRPRLTPSPSATAKAEVSSRSSPSHGSGPSSGDTGLMREQLSPKFLLAGDLVTILEGKYRGLQATVRKFMTNRRLACTMQANGDVELFDKSQVQLLERGQTSAEEVARRVSNIDARKHQRPDGIGRPDTHRSSVDRSHQPSQLKRSASQPRMAATSAPVKAPAAVAQGASSSPNTVVAPHSDARESSSSKAEDGHVVAAARALLEKQRRVRNTKPATPLSMLLDAQRMSTGCTGTGQRSSERIAAIGTFSQLGSILDDAIGSKGKTKVLSDTPHRGHLQGQRGKGAGGRMRSLKSEKLKGLYKNVAAGDKHAPLPM